MSRTDPIRPEMIIEDVLDTYPQVASVFVRRRMHCVGCPMARFETLAEACAIYRRPVAPLLNDLNLACREGAPRD